MQIFERIQAFIDLGVFLKDFSNINNKDKVFSQAFSENNFFVKENICYAFDCLSQLLNKNSLEKWIFSYNLKQDNPKTILVVCAGNIPLVSFHDILCVLILGNKIILNQSSKDSILVYFVMSKLIDIEPRFSDFISFSDIGAESDMVICTGNNNSASYFNYYFKNKPAIIRSSRTSVAILSGSETKEELHGLSKDIFLYFGLGCRNVTKIYIPKSYNFSKLKMCFKDYQSNLDCQNYYDNYNYNKAILTLNKKPFKDFENLLLVESDKLYPPVSVVFYEYYDEIENLSFNINDIQCILSNVYVKSKTISFGKAQNPQLFDYADNVDTISFLLS